MAAQPRGLLHQDFHPDNVGWRGAGEGAEMVVFDLHKNACGPRFADIAPYLGEMEGDKRRERGEYYLAEYIRFGGTAISMAVFEKEIEALVWTHRISVLPFLLQGGKVEQAAAVREKLVAIAG